MAATEFRIYTGSTYEAGHATEAAARASLATYTKRYAKTLLVPILLQVTLMPDGQPRTTQPAAGGTWGRLCGSTIWIDAPAPAIEQPVVSSDRVRSSQTRFASGVCAAGYRLECERTHGHLAAPCGAQVFPGTWHEWRPSLLNDAERVA